MAAKFRPCATGWQFWSGTVSPYRVVMGRRDCIGRSNMADQYLFDDWFKVSKSAEISECGQYRWWLRRSWVRRDSETKTVCFVMLNPSVADGIVDDPTIRRCIGFTRSWGYSVLSVRNLFPFRATEPRSLLTATEPTGGERGDVELMAAKTAA